MRFPGRTATVATLACLVSAAAFAQTPAPPADAPTVTFGGTFQVDYERAATRTTSRDRVFFRRLQLSTHIGGLKNWAGEIDLDASASVQGDRLIVRDAYMRYLGWAAEGLTVTLGNQKMPFSRSALAPTARRGLIERTAPGERPFGAPGRAIAVLIEGRHHDQRFQWAAALGSALHGPDVAEIRIDGPAESRDTFNEGVLGAGRVEWHPLGPVPRDQSDFDRSPLRVVVGAGAYTWRNDNDRNLFTTDGTGTSTVFADADHANGVELSGGLRGRGVSIDAEWHRITASTIDPRFTSGIYADGHAVFNETGIEAGYMALPAKLEVLAGFDTVAIDSRASVAYRPAIGVSYYVNRHRLKFQFLQRETFNALGVRDVRIHTTTLQAQLAF